MKPIQAWELLSLITELLLAHLSEVREVWGRVTEGEAERADFDKCRPWVGSGLDVFRALSHWNLRVVPEGSGNNYHDNLNRVSEGFEAFPKIKNKTRSPPGIRTQVKFMTNQCYPHHVRFWYTMPFCAGHQLKAVVIPLALIGGNGSGRLGGS